MPVYKALIADGVRAGYIVYEDTSFFWFCIDVYNGFSALAVNAYIACCINRAIEGVVSKLMGVISQKITSLQVKVVTQFGEVFMVDAAIDDGKVVVAVVDGISF